MFKGLNKCKSKIKNTWWKGLKLSLISNPFNFFPAERWVTFIYDKHYEYTYDRNSARAVITEIGLYPKALSRGI